MPKHIPPFCVSCTVQILDHISSKHMPLLAKIPVPVVAWSKAWVSGRSLAGIVGSNSAGGMYFSLLWMLCVVCCQTEVSAIGLSLVQRRIPTECRVLVCDREVSIMMPWPTSGCCAMEKKTCEVREEWSRSLVNRFPTLWDDFFATKPMEPITQYWGVISQKRGYLS